MKTFIKLIKTITAVLMIIAGLTALFTIDNAQDITSLIGFVIVMVTGVTGGIFLLTSTYPELTDLSEFDGDTNSIFDEYDREIEELRRENLLLIDRYSKFRAIIRASGDIDAVNKDRFPHLYRIIYEEDLRLDGNRIEGEVNDELDRFKEIYN